MLPLAFKRRIGVLMELVRPNINIDFIGHRKIAFIASLALIVASIFSLLIKGGPNYGIDFAGGMLIQVRFSQSIAPGDIKEVLRTVGIEKASVQRFGEVGGKEYLIRA
jgi:preprotein translocase subunit SecF